MASQPFQDDQHTGDAGASVGAPVEKYKPVLELAIRYHQPLHRSCTVRFEPYRPYVGAGGADAEDHVVAVDFVSALARWH